MRDRSRGTAHKAVVIGVLLAITLLSAGLIAGYSILS